MNARRLYWAAFSLAAGLSALATSVRADAVKQFPIDVDTCIDSRDAAFNWGVGTTAKIVVNGADESLTRVLFQLPDSLWSIPEDQLISVKVWFYVFQDRTADRTVTLYPLIRGFAEGKGSGTASGDGATWQACDGKKPWTCTGGDFDPRVFVDAVETKNWFRWDITPLWNNTNLRSCGAMLRMNDESYAGAASMPRAPFTSSEGAASERPYVEVTYADRKFTTCLSVDDFESYTDDLVAKTTIFDTWIDGVTNDTGSLVGYVQAPFAEQKIVHGGKQSMPLEYNNVDTPYYSETAREFSPAADWTVNGAAALVLYVRGQAGNKPAPLYVVIEDASQQISVVAHPDAAITGATRWTYWEVPLSRFAGVDLTKVKKMYLGAGDRKNPVAGGTGRIYIDDIQVTKP